MKMKYNYSVESNIPCQCVFQWLSDNNSQPLKQFKQSDHQLLSRI